IVADNTSVAVGIIRIRIYFNRETIILYRRFNVPFLIIGKAPIIVGMCMIGIEPDRFSVTADCFVMVIGFAVFISLLKPFLRAELQLINLTGATGCFLLFLCHLLHLIRNGV